MLARAKAYWDTADATTRRILTVVLTNVIIFTCTSAVVITTYHEADLTPRAWDIFAALAAILTVHIYVRVPFDRSIGCIVCDDIGVYLLLLIAPPVFAIPAIIVAQVYRTSRTTSDTLSRLANLTTPAIATSIALVLGAHLHVLGNPEALTPEAFLTILAVACLGSVFSLASILLTYPYGPLKDAIAALGWVDIIVGALTYPTMAAAGMALSLLSYQEMLWLGVVVCITAVLCAAMAAEAERSGTRAIAWIAKEFANWDGNLDLAQDTLKRLAQSSPPGDLILLLQSPVNDTYTCWHTKGLRRGSTQLRLHARSSAHATQLFPDPDHGPHGNGFPLRKGDYPWVSWRIPRQASVLSRPGIKAVHIERMPLMPLKMTFRTHGGRTHSADAMSGFTACVRSISAAWEACHKDQQDAQAQQNLLALLDHSNDGHGTVSSDGRITSWNATLEEWTNAPAELMIGKDIDNVMGTTSRIRQNGGTVTWQPFGGATRDPLTLEVRLTPILDTSHPREHAQLFIGRDVTERHLRERNRNQFLASVAHEMHNPLSGIMLNTEMLQTDPHLGNGQREIVDDILTGAEQLDTIITDLDNTASVATDGHYQLPLEMQPCPVGSALHQCLAPFPGLQARLMEIGDPKLTAMADPARLRQCLTNLLANVVRYAPDTNTIDVTYSTSDGSVNVTIRDYGPGVPAEDQDLILEPFYRGSRHKQAAGTGLGLAVTANLAQQMGGGLTYETPEGPGAQFTLRLPEPETQPQLENPTQRSAE